MICLPRSQGPTRKGPSPFGPPVPGSSIPSCHAVEVLAGEHVPGQDDAEEIPPVGEALSQGDPDRLLVERADATNIPCPTVRKRMLPSIRCEDEVRRGDGYPIAPVRLRADPVDEHEGPLRDDAASASRVGTSRSADLERTRRDLGQKVQGARLEEHVEARRLALRSRPDDEVPSRFGVAGRPYRPLPRRRGARRRSPPQTREPS